MARKLIATLILFLVAGAASAGDLFTRTWAVVTPGYYFYSNGCRYWQPDVYGWVYNTYSAPEKETYTPPAPPSYTPDWKLAFPKYLEKRDDHAAYLAALYATGANGQTSQFQSMSYYNSGYGLNALQSANISNVGVQGNSILGYNTTTSYANKLQLPAAPTLVDMQALYLASNQHVTQAGNLFGSGQLGFQALVREQAAAQTAALAREREVLVKVAAFERVMKMLEASASTTSTTTIQGTAVTPVNPIDPPPAPPMPDAEGRINRKSDRATAFLRRTGIPLCGACHSGKDPKAPGGKFDIRRFPGMTDEEKEVVFDRLTSRDPKLVMPRIKGKDEGVALTPDLLQEFVTLEPATKTP